MQPCRETTEIALPRWLLIPPTKHMAGYSPEQLFTGNSQPLTVRVLAFSSHLCIVCR